MLSFLSNWILFLLIPLYGLLRTVCWQKYLNLYYPIYLLAFGYIGYIAYHMSQGLRFEPSFLLANLCTHLIPLLILRHTNYKPNKTSIPVLIVLLVLYLSYLSRRGLTLQKVYLTNQQVMSWDSLQKHMT